MLSIAKAMAIKSTTLERDTMQKALVAFQAYKFNTKYGGRQQDGDVYAGLYYALKALKEEDYNSLKGHKDAVKSMVYAGDNLYTSGSDGNIFSWNVNNTSQEPVLAHESGDINRVLAVTADEKYLAKGTDEGGIQIFNLENGNSLHKEFEGHEKGVWAMKFSPDGKTLYSIGGDSTLNKWNVGSGKKTQISKSNSRYKNIDLSKSGKQLAAGTESGEVHIWNFAKNSDKKIYQDEKSGIYSLAFNNAGTNLAIGDRTGTIIIYDLKSNKEIANLNAHGARVNDMEFSPDDKMLATAGYDGNMLLWETENYNNEPIKMDDHNTWVMSLTFSPDGDRLIAGCVDKLIRIWPTNAKVMTEKLCDKLNRNMEKDEWKKFVAEDIDYEFTCDDIK